MPRQDGRDLNDFGQADYSKDYAYDARRRSGYRAEADHAARNDYGQADYSADWAYDRERGDPYRRYSEEDRAIERPHDERSFVDKAGDFLTGRPRPTTEAGYETERPDRSDRRRHGSSDRVLWAVIMERLESDRRVDMRDVRISVLDGEVTLDGTVRTREGKRRIEDLVDVDGVRNVQNNLRPRDAHRRWTLF